MAYDDIYMRGGRLRYAELGTQLAQERANLQAYAMQYQASNGTDVEALRSVGVAEGNIAVVAAEMQALEQLGQQHVAAMTQQPARPAPETSEEKQAKPWEKCTYADSRKWASKSKYGIDQNAFKAGMHEVAKRRARGE